MSSTLPLISRTVEGEDVTSPSSKVIDLVFSGSGVRFPIFMGVWDALKDRGFRVRKVAGTSGGSIVAALSQVHDGRLKPFLGIADLSKVTDLNIFFWRGYALYKGKRFEKMLKGLFGSRRMKDAPNLYIIGTRITDPPGEVIFSAESTPDVYLYEAVRASCSAPFFFRPKKIGKDLYVDGGLCINFAIDLFEKGPVDTVGVLIRGEKGRKGFRRGLFDYVRTIFEVMFTALENEHIEDAYWSKIKIVKTRVPSFDFSVSRKELESLYELGYNSAMDWDL